MIVALWAAIAMVIQDILGTMMTQAQARNRAALAGALDTAGWLAAIMTTTFTVTTLQGHSVALKLVVIFAVSVANFVGSYVGVKMGSRFIKVVKPSD